MTTSADETCTTKPVHAKARRRVPLQFDENGDPYFDSVTSPESFKMRALCVLPPRHVIPVIFVPGIMGTNLCANGTAQKEGTDAWTPPNGKMAGLGEFGRRRKQTPTERQKQMNPAAVKVNDKGPVSIQRGLFTLTEKEAKRRGWGQIHLDSYGGILAELESALNDQYHETPLGKIEPMPVWETAQTLKRVEKSGFMSMHSETVDVVQHDWHPINSDVPPLTETEFARLDDYYYPVWVCGYNWLDSNEVSSDLLVQRIQEIRDWYKKGKYWIPTDKVIVLTHSMGGLVTRRAAQKVGDSMLGVVHSVLPVGGAPVVYRRFRSGVETGGAFDIPGMILATILGWDSSDFTCVAAQSAGPLELLPNTYYPPGWLKFEQHRSGKAQDVMPPLPVSDPYSEIYAKRVQDVWWGMVDDKLIDPANLTPKGLEPYDLYGVTLTKAQSFHEKLKLDFHPVTYAHYGSDSGQISFGNVKWITTDEVGGDLASAMPTAQAASYTYLGAATLGAGEQQAKFKLESKKAPTEYDKTNSGDGTVPMPSGAILTQGNPPPKVFKMTGFDHQMSYANQNVQYNVLYCVAKIVQLAPPISELPSTKE
ncbi:esterase/lipase family protein [Paraburkholderia lacunae]|uniref:Alpha/beta hydrolase n=1 Tax=Paraburkholderia lacunae TaxID=2211104 RepID=A0A370N5K9_9BURK|nr:hypothetical protein [Paraburkholderia lacunae]RDK00911.1 hypothetical protein DLM46_21510 [Paraburkholderia lacunae]